MADEPLCRHLTDEELTCAIVDGINRHLRELEHRGVIDPDSMDDAAGSELCDLKYVIAADVARRWLLPPEQ